MASRVLVSGLPRSLPPLPPGPAPTCVPCVEGRQRAAPHSSEFPPTEAPLQTLHMEQGRDRGGEFSSARLGAFCRAEGIRQTFTLPASPQQNGIAERRIGMVMDVARTSMIHAAAPHFLWPFAVQYAAHQLNLQPRVSLPETSPTLLWTGKTTHGPWGPLQPVSPLPAPSPYTGPTGGLAERRAPASRPASPARAASTSRRTSRPRPPGVPGTHQMALRPSTAPLRVPLSSPPASSLHVLTDPASDSLRAATCRFCYSHRLDYAASLVAKSESVCPPSVGGECALSTDVLEDRQEEFQCFAAALPHLVSTLIAPEGDPDAPDIPTPRSYAEAIEGPYSSQWQAAMDAEMAYWKSTGTYVDEVRPPGANIVSGMWIFRVKRPPGSPPVVKARYVARGFSQRQGVDYFQTFSPTPKMTTLRVLLHLAAQRDYELHSLDFSTAFLQGSLHEEIWLRRPPGFTGMFPPGTQWSLRRPVYGLRQAPREWHDTLRTTLAALGFAPSTADPSLFLRTDTSLPLFYILVYVDDLVFATADIAGLAHVKSELQKRHTCTDLGELRSYLGLQITRDRAQCTITLTQSHMVQQVLQRFDFTYSSPQATPLSTRHSLSALPSNESVEPSGPYPELVGCLILLCFALLDWSCFAYLYPIHFASSSFLFLHRRQQQEVEAKVKGQQPLT
ncbi:unnamed protein product [Closterium sp. NIES-53]